MSNFTFLQTEWPALHEAAVRAESLVNSDARAACFYARRTLELAVQWLYRSDSTLRLPYQEHLSALLHEPTFKALTGDAVFAKTRVVKDLGNLAVHSHKPVRQFDAVVAVRELFHFTFWLARTYSRVAKPPDGLAFNPLLLSKASAASPQTRDQLQRLETQLHEKDERLAQLLADKSSLDAELVALRAEVAAAKRANQAQPDAHDYSEAETRDYFIDLLLKEAGWGLGREGHDTEYPVTGMPNAEGKGYVDYVLWGDDGRPLAVVEAKRTRKSAQAGQQQAKLYADCLERQFGRRPVIFYSNGYEHWIWDDAGSAPRAVQGFYKKPELELLIQRRTTRQKLTEAAIDQTIAERYYQTRAIRKIGEAFEVDRDRRALVVMATGAGKTRTVIALCDLLMRCNWVKRVLFLADRKALVKQAVNAFKKHLPASSPVNLVTEKDKEGRVYVSTYPTMMGLIDETADGQRQFGVGHFDLIVIDEAHRSVYQKYGAILDYFDSLLVGLTATPKDEIDRNTYRIFNLERGVPTDVYGLEDACKDGFLVRPQTVSVPLKFQREGIRYNDLSAEEQEQWDAQEWNEDGTVPTFVEPEEVNKWLFNVDTVDKVLAHLMTRGLKVAGGDRLGKTIVFAKSQPHAEFIAQRFDANYPHFKGEFARVIHCNLPYAQSLIDDFYQPQKPPHIAISVDMLDTGIDVPEVVNLVFFKLVRSKTKFWQMIGRGTRLSPDLFGPDRDKDSFYVFDYCQNLEFFQQNPTATDGAAGDSLSKRLFTARLELIGEIDRAQATVASDGATAEAILRQDLAALLRGEVTAMNLDNFVVRPKRRLVERYAQPDAWLELKPDTLAELAHEVAGLPSELESEEEEAKRFDLLLLNLQLAVLRTEPAFTRLSQQVRIIAGLLAEKASIPMVQKEMVLIEELLTDEWWQDVSLPMLENVRKRLRSLIKLIEKSRRKPVYTDFEDQMGPGQIVDLPEFTSSDTFERFRSKARVFLREHEDHLAIHRLRTNQPLTPADLTELERMLLESGVGSPTDLTKAKESASGLGRFVRSLIGLDRAAAKAAFAQFLNQQNATANQIEFINLIIDHLTHQGTMSPDLLYESPFTDLHPLGVEGVFGPQAAELVEILAEIERRSAA
jgi:type I restriction enzyme R subunit